MAKDSAEKPRSDDAPLSKEQGGEVTEPIDVSGETDNRVGVSDGVNVLNSAETSVDAPLFFAEDSDDTSGIEESGTEVEESEENEIEIDVDIGFEDSGDEPASEESEPALMSHNSDDTESDPSLFDELDMDDIFKDGSGESDEDGELSDSDEVQQDAELQHDAPLLNDSDEPQAVEDGLVSDESLESSDNSDASSLSDESGEPEDSGIDDELMEQTGISGDALWEDDGESDDISLFEDILMQEELAAEEEEKKVAEEAISENAPTASGSGSLSDSGEDASSASDKISTEGHAEQGEDYDDIEEEDVEYDDTSPLVAWIVTAVALVMAVAGGVTLWLLMNSPVRYETEIPVAPEISKVTPKPDVKQNEMSETALDDSLPERKSLDFVTLNISSFIIPVIKDGETVFLKLRVEFVLPDNRTLAAFRKREAWVRDAIYMELKGITFEPGMRGDVLLRYRRPLLEKLRKQMAPLEILDIRLSGLMLK